jgi:hypothetical protein
MQEKVRGKENKGSGRRKKSESKTGNPDFDRPHISIAIRRCQ